VPQVISRWFPIGNAGFQNQASPFSPRGEGSYSGEEVFFRVFCPAAANADDIQYQKYSASLDTALEILRSIRLSLDILFYLLIKDKRYYEADNGAQIQKCNF
jgi:hypothetical protein